MEEEGGDDSDVIDAMDGWDSEDQDESSAANSNAQGKDSPTNNKSEKGGDGS